MDAADKTIVCSDCQANFTVTVTEQAWLAERFGETYRLPRRCLPCRQKRRAAHPQPARSGVAPAFEEESHERSHSRRTRNG